VIIPGLPTPNNTRVLILIFHSRKSAFIGIIPENQQAFINELKVSFFVIMNVFIFARKIEVFYLQIHHL